MFDTHGGADFIEGVLATTLPLSCGEEVGQLRAAVGRQFDDPDRRGQLDPAQRSTLLLSVGWARDGVMGRGTDRRRPISSLDQAVTRSQARSLAGCPGPKTIHRFFIFQEVWISRVYDGRGD